MNIRTIGLLGVAGVAFGLAYILPTTEIMKGVVATPGILGLLGVLYQLIRDEASFERSKLIQGLQHSFGIGASSHMANTVFDKHVEFCEKYIDEVHVIADKLFREGPTKESVYFGNKLYALKLEYALWLTDEINDDLFAFEQGLRGLGASQGFIDSTEGHEQYAKERQKRMSQVHEDYIKILNLDGSQKPDPDFAVESVVRKARDILCL
ncbi:hypothetical protein [uncultured Desulfobacter sp.]|uniref:hypothetical protein n=1 Tax=uncultured Desulfobacter sp. TaxID=240139 RepID=UPI002AAA65EA|nr:hypothetical protein [uncultured Desulfobacter sp.]